VRLYRSSPKNPVRWASGRASFHCLSQVRNSTTTVLRHIHRGNLVKSASASMASMSEDRPRTQRLARYASGQSASTATMLKLRCSMSAAVRSARIR
jgi:hypothetical protein